MRASVNKGTRAIGLLVERATERVLEEGLRITAQMPPRAIEVETVGVVIVRVLARATEVEIAAGAEAATVSAIVPFLQARTQATRVLLADLLRAETARAEAVRAVLRAWAPAEADRVAEGDGGETMRDRFRVTFMMSIVHATLLALFFLMASPAASAQTAGSTGASSPAPQQKMFATPQAAADALIQGAKTYDVPALEEILGPQANDLLSSEDPVRDKNAAAEFAAKASEKTAITVDAKNAARATVLVGDDGWPLPIPLLKKGNTWYFDTEAGREEMLRRRIGSNELDAIEICRGYVSAQLEYATQKHDNSDVNQYAQRVISTSGKHDGLVWSNSDGTLGGPIAEGIAKALQQGYTDKSQPYHGYFFKILKGQGPAAPLGQLDFVVEGAMIGGFALAAAPAEYRVTGVQTFIVSYEGVVYQKDLGSDTLKIFREMELYNPDKTWQPTEDNW